MANSAPGTAILSGNGPERLRPMVGRIKGDFLTKAEMDASELHPQGGLFSMADRFPEQCFTPLGPVPTMNYDRVPPYVELVRS